MNEIPEGLNKKDRKERSGPEKSREFIAQLVEDLEESKPELLKNIPNKEEVVSEIFSIVTHSIEIKHQEHHSGPLPHPEILREYDEIFENGAERIVAVFEKQVNHRMELEKKVVGSQILQSKLGQIFGFSLAIIFLFAGMFLVMHGHDAAGITIFSLDIVGLVAVFVIGKQKQKKDLKKVE